MSPTVFATSEEPTRMMTDTRGELLHQAARTAKGSPLKRLSPR